MTRQILLAMLSGLLVTGAAQNDMDARQRRGRAIEGMVQSSGDEALRRFIDVHLAPAYRDSFGPNELIAHLAGIRDAAHGFDGILGEPVGDGGIRLTFISGPRRSSLVFRIEAEPPHRIVALEFEGTQEIGDDETTAAPPYTWSTLAARLEEEEKAGFSGTVLVVRDDKIVLHRGYGFADRARQRRNDTETIFAIGSIPIDFTKAAILKLEEMGKLRTSDAITQFVAAVPADKRLMTIHHLMTGTSGLPDFHHINGVDSDPDLAWIERETAIQRILAQDLVFAPGSGEAHSHSAWVLLAALVEIVSGDTYGAFLNKHFFEPAGMKRTGLHEDAAAFSDDEFAIGYEGQSVGKLNTPRYWGRTSWLVMGSGGMMSTPHDLYKWLVAIRTGKTLSPAAAAKYWTDGVLAGGDDRGFFCLYTEGPGSFMILSSNAHTRRGDRASTVGRRLIQLVRSEPRP